MPYHMTFNVGSKVFSVCGKCLTVQTNSTGRIVIPTKEQRHLCTIGLMNCRLLDVKWYNML